MPIDIGKVIKFSPKKPESGGLPKIKINALLDIPVIIHEWRIENSVFTDGNADGVYADITVETPGDNQKWQLNTASSVIIEQLAEIRKSIQNGTPVSCIIKRAGKAYKLFPAEAC